MDKKDKKIIIASLTMTINHLDDASEKFVKECIDVRNKLENLTKQDSSSKKDYYETRKPLIKVHLNSLVMKELRKSRSKRSPS